MTLPREHLAGLLTAITDNLCEAHGAHQHWDKETTVVQLRNIQRLLNDTWPPEPADTGHDWTAEIPF